MNMNWNTTLLAAVCCALAFPVSVLADQKAKQAALAETIQNPIANLVTLPFQYNLNADAERHTRKHYATLSAQSIFNTQQGVEATSQHYLKFLMTQFTKGNWGPFELGQLQSNPDQGYDLRFLVGGGATRFFIETTSQPGP